MTDVSELPIARSTDPTDQKSEPRPQRIHIYHHPRTQIRPVPAEIPVITPGKSSSASPLPPPKTRTVGNANQVAITSSNRLYPYDIT